MPRLGPRSGRATEAPEPSGTSGPQIQEGRLRQVLWGGGTFVSFRPQPELLPEPPARRPPRYYRARRLDEAARQFRLVEERRPEEAHQQLFALFRQADRHQEALREADALMRRVGVPETDRAALERLAPEAAGIAFLRGTVAHLRRDASRFRVPPERMALLHAALGESAAAIGWLSLAEEERSPGLVTTLVDPTLDPLRAEPEFVSLVRRVGWRALPGAS